MQGTLNRDAVYVCMHLRSSADVKEPGRPSKSHRDYWCRHAQTPED